ncbi:hypothetical protein B566_EDAN013656 [Ephemera danica]|nr:hypothetical protein B566_EDAN013656 [Ephemera danica]
MPEYPPMDEVFNGYRISYLYYSPLGWMITMVVGTVASLIWDKKSMQHVDPALLAPIVRKWFIKKHQLPSRNSSETGSEERNSSVSSHNEDKY